ncbi:unnamed protein product [Vitrella brassicaformis CCMP3155]|uniref:UVR domain-containing protein n=2 Tax=Vitrella brassicaformis TaxID=1169539 RepID=A0A0G4EZY8_VITBC|nr:unnamed protein product [Vitrella brassicaformis CCMP3155]|eukprot:CEM04799.1 unnamed protein product [Vitrella brassicaformis CCMP3155]
MRHPYRSGRTAVTRARDAAQGADAGPPEGLRKRPHAADDAPHTSPRNTPLSRLISSAATHDGVAFAPPTTGHPRLSSRTRVGLLPGHRHGEDGQTSPSRPQRSKDKLPVSPLGLIGDGASNSPFISWEQFPSVFNPYLFGNVTEQARLCSQLRTLEISIKEAAENKEYEKAANLRDTIRGLKLRDPISYLKAMSDKMDEAVGQRNFEGAIRWRDLLSGLRSYLPQFNLKGVWVGEYGNPDRLQMVTVDYEGEWLVARKLQLHGAEHGDGDVDLHTHAAEGQHDSRVTFRANLSPDTTTSTLVTLYRSNSTGPSNEKQDLWVYVFEGEGHMGRRVVPPKPDITPPPTASSDIDDSTATNPTIDPAAFDDTAATPSAPPLSPSHTQPPPPASASAVGAHSGGAGGGGGQEGTALYGADPDSPHGHAVPGQLILLTENKFAFAWLPQKICILFYRMDDEWMKKVMSQEARRHTGDGDSAKPES